jgi:hypothetical protein
MQLKEVTMMGMEKDGCFSSRTIKFLQGTFDRACELRGIEAGSREAEILAATIISRYKKGVSRLEELLID